MPRSTRYLQNGFIYREWVRVGARRYRVAVLGYAITSNHVHVVVDVEDRHAVADMMKLAAGVAAQACHRRKGGEDSMWKHPYQCTRIQDGRYLLNSMQMKGEYT